MNPAILDTFKRTMQIEDLSARSNALQSMVTQFNLGEMFGDAQTVEFLAPMLANMEAVSYTHLDVYKRQLLRIKARGYRNRERFKLGVMFHYGKLNMAY